MKIEVKNKDYKFITDNSKEINSDGVFLLTEQNKIYKKEVEKKGFAFFLTPSELFSQWNLDKLKIIGVTGTNGKTTTTNIIAHILKNLKKKVAVSGTEGIFLHSKNFMKKIVERTTTTPNIFSTLKNLKKAKENGAEFFVMEVSSHGIFQKRIEGIKFSAKVFTNLTQDHLDFHETFEEYCNVKSSFFSDSDSVKIINSDDKFIKYNSENLFTYSMENKISDIYTKNLNFENGILAELFFENKKRDKPYSLQSLMIGKFNLYNILASISVIKILTDFPMEKILENLRDFKGVDGRMEIIYKKENIKIFIDYAHTPDAIKNVLNSIDKKNQKIITIIGAGGDRDSSKRPLMAKIACENSNKVFLTSDNSRFENPEKILNDMEQGVQENFLNYEIIEDRKKAIFSALKMAEKTSKEEEIIIAILGKGNENYLDIEGKKYPYSDKEEVLSFFKK